MVLTTTDWGWWFDVGDVYEVEPYPYKATSRATLNYCDCALCEAERFGLELFDMYRVVTGLYRGSIIPVKATVLCGD